MAIYHGQKYSKDEINFWERAAIIALEVGLHVEQPEPPRVAANCAANYADSLLLARQERFLEDKITAPIPEIQRGVRAHWNETE